MQAEESSGRFPHAIDSECPVRIRCRILSQCLKFPFPFLKRTVHCFQKIHPLVSFLQAVCLSSLRLQCVA